MTGEVAKYGGRIAHAADDRLSHSPADGSTPLGPNSGSTTLQPTAPGSIIQVSGPPLQNTLDGTTTLKPKSLISGGKGRRRAALQRLRRLHLRPRQASLHKPITQTAQVDIDPDTQSYGGTVNVWLVRTTFRCRASQQDSPELLSATRQ